MIQKKVLNPCRIRKINSSFAFIEHRFRGWIKCLSPEERQLYFFLVLAADEQGLSYYRPETIGERLQLNPDQYRRGLERVDHPVSRIMINGPFRRGWDHDISPPRDHVNSPPSRRPEVTASR